MGVVIDTSVLVDIERRRAAPDVLLASVGGGRLLLSAVTVSELLYGLGRTTDPSHHARRSAFIERVLFVAEVLAIDEQDARAHAALRVRLEQAGTPIGPNDFWIAAQALARGHAVATLNVREFARVPGLRLAS